MKSLKYLALTIIFLYIITFVVTAIKYPETFVYVQNVPMTATTYDPDHTYWISPTGTATWENCKSATELNGEVACALSTANTNATAGDTVYLRGGTYFNQFINPTNSGIQGNIITYSAYNNEEVILNNGGSTDINEPAGVDLSQGAQPGKSYIKVHGITVDGFFRPLSIVEGSHNEISHVVFSNYSGNVKAIIYRNATYNWIHDSEFSKGGYTIYDPETGTCDDLGGLMTIGLFSDVNDFTAYNLVENSTFFHGGHHLIENNGHNNIFRNNYFHNEEWMDCSMCGRPTNYCGNRNAGSPSDSYNGYRGLWEKNSIGLGGIPPDGVGGQGAGLEIATPNNIVRLNRIYGNSGPGIFFYKKGSKSSPDNNYTYSNTLIRNGDGAFNTPHMAGIEFVNAYNNIIKNNIVFDNFGSSFKYIPLAIDINQLKENNLFEDPLFINSSIGDPFGEQPDFRLQSGSGAINSGGFLTTIISPTNSGITFTIADAGYFMDGWGMEALGVEGDTLQLEGQTKRVQITNINYDTNTVTVNESLSWTEGQGISLAYNGTAPDIGAYESNYTNSLPDTYTLNITTENGTVTKNPNQETYTAGQEVILEAFPINNSYTFTGWSGALTGSTNPVTITIGN